MSLESFNYCFGDCHLSHLVAFYNYHQISHLQGERVLRVDLHLDHHNDYSHLFSTPNPILFLRKNTVVEDRLTVVVVSLSLEKSSLNPASCVLNLNNFFPVPSILGSPSILIPSERFLHLLKEIYFIGH